MTHSKEPFVTTVCLRLDLFVLFIPHPNRLQVCCVSVERTTHGLSDQIVIESYIMN